MAITMARWDWSKQQHDRVPVNEAVLQDMVDTLFASRRYLEDPEWLELRMRRWQAEMLVPAPTVGPDVVGGIQVVAPKRRHRAKVVA